MFTFLAMLCVLFVSTNSLDFMFYDISSDLLIDNCSKLHAILYRSSINIVKGYPAKSFGDFTIVCLSIITCVSVAVPSVN